jgi:hypothetical protein
MKSRLAWLAVAGVLLLSGCAAFDSLTAYVSSTGDWPAERKPGSFAFERLPSQQAQAEDTAALEAAALGALLKAGFAPVAPGQEPEVLVQVGARDRLIGVQIWDDPLWWRGGYGSWRYGPWMGPYWGWSGWYQTPRYEREVALLIRARGDGRPLFETRAASEGNSAPGPRALAAMYDAALMDFPRLGLNPRRVVVTLPE